MLSEHNEHLQTCSHMCDSGMYVRFDTVTYYGRISDLFFGTLIKQLETYYDRVL